MSSSSPSAAVASTAAARASATTGGYRMLHRNSSLSSGSHSENLPPRALARISREIRDLHKSPPEGIRLVVDSETGVPASLGEVLAEIEGPQGTPYETKFFRVKLVLSADFPASPPRGFFLTKIYHPNVDMSAGTICVNTLKKDWTCETTFAHVLAVIRCLLIVPFPESSLNDEAGKLFMESYDEYAKRARLMADVHGRPFSCVGEDPTTNSGAAEGSKRRKEVNDDEEDECVNKPTKSPLRSSSLQSNSNTTNNSTNISNCNNNSKRGVDKKIKKKSLKRL